jgi:hypothetical protein
MKAICIKNYDDVKSRTTIGKVYEILKDHDSDDEFFVDDNGDELWYHSYCFITVEQWRENQLNKIGIGRIP